MCHSSLLSNHSMKKNLLCGFILVVCFATSVRAQSVSTTNIIPPSPTSSEFEKFTKYNVSIYNGIPDIGIPLYEVKVGGLTIPIALNYHASGVKYGQTVSDAGVGWQLSPGYRVSRSVYGSADEIRAMPASFTSGLSQSRFALDDFLAQFKDENSYHDFPESSTGLRLDGEYDLFNYNLGSANGSFIISDRQSKQVAILDGDNTRIAYNIKSGAPTTSDRIDYFDMIDSQGIKYRLGTNASGNTDGIEVAQMGTSESDNVNTAWLVRDIVTLFGDQVSFAYEKRWERQYRVNQTFIATVGSLVYGNSSTGYTSDGDFYNDYKVPFLTTISTPTETITFIRAVDDPLNFQDNKVTSIEVRDLNGNLTRRITLTYTGVPYQNGVSPIVLLSTVNVYGGTDPTPQVYQFDYYSSGGNDYLTYDYFGYVYPYTFGQVGFHALPTELGEDQLMEVGAGNSCYAIAAKNLNQLSSGPSMLFQTKPAQTPVSHTLSQITYPTGGYARYFYEANKYLGSTGLPEAGSGLRISRIESCSLSKSSPDCSENIRTYAYGVNDSGIGIALVTPDLHHFAQDIVKFEMAGIVVSDATALNRIYNSTYLGSPAMADAISHGLVFYPEVNVYYSGSGSQMGNGKEHYVFDPGYRGNESKAFTTNRTISFIFCSLAHRVYSPTRINTYHFEQKEPSLLVHEIYDKQNSLIQREDYLYGIMQTSSFTGLQVRKFASNYWPDSDPMDPYSRFSFDSFFDYATYSIAGGKTYLTQKTTTQYVNNTPTLSTIEKYTYNNAFQVISESITDSHDGSKITQFTHPTDYTSLTASDPVTLGVRNLQTLNILEPVLEKSQWSQQGSVNTLLYSQYTPYKTTSPVPDKIMTIDTNVPLSDFVISSSASGAVTLDNRYTSKVSFDAYSAKGNILQQKKLNDVPLSYVWDYKDRFPIAEVKNAAVQDIAYTSFEADGTGGWQVSKASTVDTSCPTGTSVNTLSTTSDYVKNTGLTSTVNYKLSFWYKGDATITVTGGTQQNIVLQANKKNGWNYTERTITGATTVTIAMTGSGAVSVDEVRLYPVGAQMSTYTYFNDGKLQSATDANNVTIYYEYDGFDRLKAIRNDAGSLLSNYEYHYKQQQ